MSFMAALYGSALMQDGAAGGVVNYDDSSYTGIIEDAEPVNDAGQSYPGDSYSGMIEDAEPFDVSGQPYPGNSYSGICDDNAPVQPPQVPRDTNKPQTNGRSVNCLSNRQLCSQISTK